MRRITELKRMEVFLVVSLCIAVLGVLVAFAGKDRGEKSAKQVAVYCGSEGILSNTKPIQSHRSYCIKSNIKDIPFAPNTPASYSFSIVDDQGITVRDFAVTHTKRMHVIVVRKDLANFQHVHPEFDPKTGVFTLANLTLSTDGQYRIFADFAPSGTQMDPNGQPLVVTISEDVSIGKVVASKFIGTEAAYKTFDGYAVELLKDQSLVARKEAKLTFNITQGDAPVTNLEEYLGALGHSVVLREGTLDFIHAHPLEDVSAKQNGIINFMVSFPQSGNYKIFTQFQRGGKIVTTDFVVSVAEGPTEQDATSVEGQVPNAGHMMH